MTLYGYCVPDDLMVIVWWQSVFIACEIFNCVISHIQWSDFSTINGEPKCWVHTIYEFIQLLDNSRVTMF